MFYHSYSTWHTFAPYWRVFKESLESERRKQLYPGSLIAATGLLKPYPNPADSELITMAFISLLERNVALIRNQADYIHITLSVEMILPNALSISYSLAKAIPIHDTKGSGINWRAVYDQIYDLVRIEGEKYK